MNTQSAPLVLILAAAGLLAGSSSLAGQASAPFHAPEIRLARPGELQELRLVDGSVMYGAVTEVGDTVSFRLVSGDLVRIVRSRVAELGTANGEVKNGVFFREDPNRSRLFFAPTGRSIPRGGGYFAVYEVYVPFVAVAPHDRLILSGGTPLIFGGDESGRPFWLSAKVQVADQDRLKAGVGGIVLHADDEVFGILFGVATLGDSNGAVTLGAGYGFADGELADRPALLLGGETRASVRSKLITENYLFPGGGGLVSGGVRFLGERLSADVALGTLVGDEADMVLFPLVNFTWNW